MHTDQFNHAPADSSIPGRRSSAGPRTGSWVTYGSRQRRCGLLDLSSSRRGGPAVVSPTEQWVPAQYSTAFRSSTGDLILNARPGFDRRLRARSSRIDPKSRNGRRCSDLGRSTRIAAARWSPIRCRPVPPVDGPSRARATETRSHSTGPNPARPPSPTLPPSAEACRTADVRFVNLVPRGGRPSFRRGRQPPSKSVRADRTRRPRP